MSLYLIEDRCSKCKRRMLSDIKNTGGLCQDCYEIVENINKQILKK